MAPSIGLGIGISLPMGGEGLPPEAPANTVLPVASGSLDVGDLLSTTDGTWTGSPPPSFTYQWNRTGSPIAGATSSTYTLVVADAGLGITCEVTGTGAPPPATAESNVLTANALSAPVNTVAPVASGSQLLSTTDGTWTGNDAGFVYTYQWQRDTVDISGETSSTYMTVAADEGTDVRCEVTATNAHSGVAANSNAIAVTAFEANIVSNNEAGYHLVTGGLVDDSKITISLWLQPRPGTLTGIRGYYMGPSASGLQLYSSGAKLGLRIPDAAGTALYSGVSVSDALQEDVLQHIYFSRDSATDATELKVNDVAVSMTGGLSSLGTSVTMDIDGDTGILANNAGGEIPDCWVTEFWVTTGAIEPSADLYNAGTPPNLAGVGSPQLWWGHFYTASDWNLDDNLGSHASTIEGPTFTDPLIGDPEEEIDMRLAVFMPYDGQPPATNYATLDTRNGVPVLDFDDTTSESIEFGGFMPDHYAGGGITVTLGWMFTSSGTPGTDTCAWEVSLMSVTADADDLDTKAFAAANTAVAVSASADGEVAYEDITFTDGADMDSVAAGEYFRMKVERDAASGTASPGDAELVFVSIKETP